MKSEFLKIAGVKTERQFYAKFPDEKSFFKAHPEAKKLIKKAQAGTDINGDGVPDLLQPIQNPSGVSSFNPGNTSIPGSLATPNAMGAANQMLTPSNPFALSNAGNTWAANNTLPQGVIDTSVPSDIGYTPPKASTPFDIMPYVGAATSVLGGFEALGAQKKALKEARMWNKITGLQARAAESVDVDANKPKRYVRPEDQIVQPNQLFPTYGVGTNVLAKDGAEIQNTYAPNTLYDNLGYEPLEDSDVVKQYAYGGEIPQAQAGGEFMNFMGNQGGAQALGMLSGAMFDNSGGSQIGGGLGTALGTAFGGLGGGVIGNFAGSALGGILDNTGSKIKKEQKDIERNMNRMMGAQLNKSLHNQYSTYMEDGGWVSHNWNPQVIAKFGDHSPEDVYEYAHEGMESLRSGGNLKDSQYTPVSNRGLQTYAMGGELKTHWGGYAETMSQNPYLPGGGETVMFRGKSHEESDGSGRTGIGITYGNNPVEVERGEPATKLKDGSTGEESLTVYGNLSTHNFQDILGKEAKNKKFKTLVSDWSKQEIKGNKLVNKAAEIANKENAKPLDFSTAKALEFAGKSILKNIAEKKIDAAHLQNAINDTAEEHGLVADDLAKGKIKVNKEALKEYAEYGKDIPKAQAGTYKIKGKGKKWSYTPAGETGVAEFDDPGLYVTQWSKSIDDALNDKERADQMIKYLENAPGPEGQKVREALASRKNRDEKIKFIKEQATNSQVGPMHYVVRAARDVTMPKKKEVTTTQTTTAAPKEKTYKTTPYKRSVLMDAANMILPFIRPTDQEPLNPQQLLGEMYALSTNQLEPVQAQQFTTELATPYDISFQDQMNEITAQTRAAQRMAQGNPVAQALINAQAYDAINEVKGEEFRANQAMKMGVYDQNRQALNQARQANLALLDQQYQRQAQAKSNTKAIAQSALNSISDKYAKNRLENRELGIYENLYNYRYDPSGRAINMNPLFQPNMPVVYSEQKNANMLPVYDDEGEQTGWRPAAATPGIVSEEEPQPAKFGKAVKKYAKNGSIVKAYKNL